MNDLDSVRRRFIEAMSQIAQFWGFPRAMGAVYGALYLSGAPLSLDDLVSLAGVTKGAVSTHVRALGRLQMVRRHVEVGDRKDYYVAETQLWTVVRNVLGQRRSSEFDQALVSVRELTAMARKLPVTRREVDQRALYVSRLEAMQAFFTTLDSIVGALLTLDEIRLSAAQRVVSSVLSRRGERKRGQQ